MSQPGREYTVTGLERVGDVVPSGGCIACGTGIAFGPAICSKLGPEWRYEREYYGCGVTCPVKDPLGITFPGTQVGCKKQFYLGDATTCCTTGESGVAGATCDPQYIEDRLVSTACRDAWLNKCNTFEGGDCQRWADSNLRDPDVLRKVGEWCKDGMWEQWCSSWSVKNREFYDGLMERYCSSDENIGKAECQKWCRDNPGKCDESARKYCVGKNNDFCSCINSPATDLQVNPRCYDAKCVRGGYLTQNMKGDCPDIVKCETILRLNAGGKIEFKDNTIVNECQSKGKEAEIEMNSPDIDRGEGSSNDNNIAMYGIIAIVFMFVLIAMISIGLVMRHFYIQKNNIRSDV